MRVAALAVTALLPLALACGDDGGGNPADAAQNTDAPAAADAPPAADSGPADAFVPPPDGPPGDAVSAADLGPVDCRNDGECPGSSTCTESAPGGACTGCISIADCPSDTDCYPQFGGACIRDGCTSDADCNLGKECLTGSGRCAIRSCSPQSPCPAPYVCVGNACARPMCGDNDACPAPLVCGGTYCVEP